MGILALSTLCSPTKQWWCLVGINLIILHVCHLHAKSPELICIKLCWEVANCHIFEFLMLYPSSSLLLSNTNTLQMMKNKKKLKDSGTEFYENWCTYWLNKVILGFKISFIKEMRQEGHSCYPLPQKC